MGDLVWWIGWEIDMWRVGRWEGLRCSHRGGGENRKVDWRDEALEGTLHCVGYARKRSGALGVGKMLDG